MPKRQKPEFLSSLRKRSLWLRYQPNKVAPHSEYKWNHRN